MWPGVPRPRRSPKPADVRRPMSDGRSQGRQPRSAAALPADSGPDDEATAFLFRNLALEPAGGVRPFAGEDHEPRLGADARERELRVVGRRHG